MDPHSSRADLIRKRRHYREKLVAASHSHRQNDPHGRLIAIDKTAEKASEVGRRAAQWIVAFGALRNLGIEVNQATVGRYFNLGRSKAP